MWHKLNINNGTYFCMCTTERSTLCCVLFDASCLQRVWRGRMLREKAVEEVKKLNKRIKFDEATIMSTLKGAEPVQATWATAQNGSGSGVDLELVETLKLKYHVVGYPFNFEWPLKKQTEQHLMNLIGRQISEVVGGLTAQVVQLRQIVQAKDEELKQYKVEGAILRRTTVATKPFNMEEFNEVNAEINELSKGIQSIGESLHKDAERAEETIEELNIKAESLKEEIPTNSRIKREEKEPEERKPQTLIMMKKESPRNRKRKAIEMQDHYIERKINARKLKLEYENSQTSGESQELEEALKKSVEDEKFQLKTEANEEKVNNEELNRTTLEIDTSKSMNEMQNIEINKQAVECRKLPIRLKEIEPKVEKRNHNCIDKSKNSQDSKSGVCTNELNNYLDSVFNELEALDKLSKEFCAK